jgi:putative nucleotidyltransferase with HDIG domain
MDREEVLSSIQANVQDKNAVNHMLATEAIMRALAKRLGQDENEWGLTGLVHDIDVELVKDDPNSHSKLAADIARELGASENMAHAILCHNQAHGIPRETKLDKALFCAESLSAVITAALIHPRRPKALTTEAVKKLLHTTGSGGGANLEQVAQCREIGLELDEFISLGLEAMKGITSTLRE